MIRCWLPLQLSRRENELHWFAQLTEGATVLILWSRADHVPTRSASTGGWRTGRHVRCTLVQCSQLYNKLVDLTKLCSWCSTSCVVLGGGRPRLTFKSLWYFQSDTTKKKINFRGYSLIYINKMISLKSIHLIYSHWVISLQFVLHCTRLYPLYNKV